jgi:hypothetical protein
LGERVVRNDEVRGSIPLRSTIEIIAIRFELAKLTPAPAPDIDACKTWRISEKFFMSTYGS